jgi:hypothetical protein
VNDHPTKLTLLARIATPRRVRFYLIGLIAAFVTLYTTGLVMLERDPLLDPAGAFLGNDFVAYYTGGKLWLQGEGDEIYDLDRQERFQQSLVSKPMNGRYCPFVSPPHTILLAAPFSLTDYLTGLLLWLAVGIFSVGVGLWLLQKIVPGEWHWPQLVLLTILFPSTITWLLVGQATGLVFVIWAATLTLLVRDRDFWAGFVLAQLAFKPQLAIPLAIPLIVALRWRALLGGLVGLGLWAIVTLAFLSVEARDYLDFGDDILAFIGGDRFPRQGIHSLYGFFLLLVEPLQAHWVAPLTWGSSIALVAFLAFLWWRVRWDPNDPLWWTRWVITLVLGPLLCVQLFTYDLTLLVIPLAIVAGLLPRRPGVLLDGGPILTWSALLYLWILLAPPINDFFLERLKEASLPQITIQATPLLLAGWSWSVWRTMQRSRTESWGHEESNSGSASKTP